MGQNNPVDLIFQYAGLQIEEAGFSVRVWTFVGVAQDNQSKCAGTAKIRAGKLASLKRPSAHVGFSRE
jgi:hypothetical protein